MATELAFRRVGENIAAGQTRQLGSFIVDGYRQIRVVADERQGSANDVDVRLTMTEGENLVAQLDVLKLTPGLEATKVYDVPGTKLTVYATAATGTEDSSSTVDVMIYGSSPSREGADWHEPAPGTGANRPNRQPESHQEGVDGEERATRKGGYMPNIGEESTGSTVSHMQDSEKKVPVTETKEDFEAQREDLEEIRGSLGVHSQWSALVQQLSTMQKQGQNNLFVGIGIVVLGAVVLIVALLLKLRPANVVVSALQPSEFIVAFAVGTLLVIIGGLLQTYSYKAQVDERKSLVEHTEAVVRDTTQLEASLFKDYVDAKYNKGEAAYRTPGEAMTEVRDPTRPRKG